MWSDDKMQDLGSAELQLCKSTVSNQKLEERLPDFCLIMVAHSLSAPTLHRP
jgi:hypothetical protein